MAVAFQKVRSTFNVSRVAQAGALAALADQAHSRSILERTRIERERIMAGIARLGCEAFPSVGNFVSARTPKPDGEVCVALEARGVVLSRMHAPRYEHYARLTPGHAADHADRPAARGVVMEELWGAGGGEGGWG